MSMALHGLEWLILKIGLWVVIAILFLLFRLLRAKAAQWWQRRRNQRASEPTQRPAVPIKHAKSGQAILRGVSGYYQGAQIPLDDKPVFLGRDPAAANLVFPAEMQAIASRHCMIKFERGSFWLQDLWSTNGTLHNGAAIAPGQPRELKPGDHFILGDNKFEVSFA